MASVQRKMQECNHIFARTAFLKMHNWESAQEPLLDFLNLLDGLVLKYEDDEFRNTGEVEGRVVQGGEEMGTE